MWTRRHRSGRPAGAAMAPALSTAPVPRRLQTNVPAAGVPRTIWGAGPRCPCPAGRRRFSAAGLGTGRWPHAARPPRTSCGGAAVAVETRRCRSGGEPGPAPSVPPPARPRSLGRPPADSAVPLLLVVCLQNPFIPHQPTFSPLFLCPRWENWGLPSRPRQGLPLLP